MKFQFKIQQFQTDAVNSVVNIFAGQPFNERVSYVRDLGNVKKIKNNQISFFSVPETSDDAVPIGFENARLALTREQMLLNTRNIQTHNNIKQSDSLVSHLGDCSLDVEMETGTGKTYIYKDHV